MRRGFTLVELLTCLGIVGILVGLLFPVMRSARRQGKVTASLSNLRQFHLALKMYQLDDDGDGKYGSPEAMGFPPQDFITLNRFGTPVAMWQSPCGQDYQWRSEPWVIQYDFYPYLVDDRHIAQIAQKFKENLLTFDDMNCTDDYEPLDNPLLPHRGLGILLSGQLINQKKPGSCLQADWWARPQE